MCEKYQNSRYKLLPVALGYVCLISTELEAFVLLAVSLGLEKAHPIILLACWQQSSSSSLSYIQQKLVHISQRESFWIQVSEIMALLSAIYSDVREFKQSYNICPLSFHWIDISWNSNRELWAAGRASVQFKWILTQKLYIFLPTFFKIMQICEFILYNFF